MRIAAALALVLVASEGLAGEPLEPKRYRPFEMSEMEALAPVLKRHVAYLEARVAPTADQPFSGRDQSGYGVALERDLVAALAFNVERAKEVIVHGPNGKKVRGEVVLYDVKRRVALVRTSKPLSYVGLAPPEIVPKHERREGMDVFALVSVDEHAGVVHGALTELGEAPEYEGHPRIDLKLDRGMPVFDDRARLIGYSRVVAWDVDRFMLITPEMIALARTSTGAAAREEKPASPKDERPWWAK